MKKPQQHARDDKAKAANDAPEVSRQALWQRQRAAEGLCVICRQKAAPGRVRCPECLASNNQRALARYRRLNPSARRYKARRRDAKGEKGIAK